MYCWGAVYGVSAVSCGVGGLALVYDGDDYRGASADVPAGRRLCNFRNVAGPRHSLLLTDSSKRTSNRRKLDNNRKCSGRSFSPKTKTL